MNIGVIGRGEIGSVLGEMFEKSGAPVSYWDTRPGKSTVSSLEELGNGADVVFVTTPSGAVGESAAALPAVSRPATVITLAKGVEPGFKTMDAVLAERAPSWAHGLLYGPMLAEELGAGKHAAAILALSDAHWHEALAKALAPQLRLEATADTKTIGLCGPLKNCYAITLGICDGLGLGMNAKGALLVGILAEMERVLKTLGADPRAACGLAGLGDIMTTGGSDFSANYRFGTAAARGLGNVPHGEGVNTLREAPSVIDFSHAPILAATHAVVVNGGSAQSITALI